MVNNTHKRQSFAVHPYKLFVYLIIGGITVLFLSLSFAYAYSRWHNGFDAIKIPVIFVFNTVVLLASSVLLHRANKYYRQDETKLYKKMLLWVIILTLLFLLGQGFGWYQLFTSNVSIAHSNGASYLYLISGVHFLHVIAGLPFLIAFYQTAIRKMVEPVSVLLYFSDPEKKVKLELLTTYWHFLDALWIYLVMFFAVNYLL